MYSHYAIIVKVHEIPSLIATQSHIYNNILYTCEINIIFLSGLGPQFIPTTVTPITQNQQLIQ